MPVRCAAGCSLVVAEPRCSSLDRVYRATTTSGANGQNIYRVILQNEQIYMNDIVEPFPFLNRDQYNNARWTR